MGLIYKKPNNPLISISGLVFSTTANKGDGDKFAEEIGFKTICGP